MGKTSVKFVLQKDNSGEVIKELGSAVERALEIIGGKAETYAKQNCPVDTGLLRNSITHAVGGNTPAVQAYTASKGGGSGSYSGTVGKAGDQTVYIGSNVEYAADNELHHKTKSGFLRNACENHRDEYKEIIKSELKR